MRDKWKREITLIKKKHKKIRDELEKIKQ